MLDRVNVRFGRPALTGEMYLEAMNAMRSGDIILTWTKWRPTNLFIPGHWSHAVMVTDPTLGMLVEAAMPNARVVSMVDVWTMCTEVKIVRPSFMSDEQRMEMAVNALMLVGTPYDLEFHSDDKALYCSELILLAMATVLGSDTPRVGREAYGEFMTIPEDFDNDDFFETIFDSRQVG